MYPWERRLKDLSHLLASCGTTYFEPELFRLNTNQFLQTSRTVTFIIQKNKHGIPDFETWYASHVVDPWRTDRIMSWAKNSRNIIEKEGDLALHSSLRLSLIFSYIGAEDIVLSGTDPALLPARLKRLVRWARRRLPTGVANAAVLKLERRWIANSLPSVELVYGLTYVYSRIYDVCSSLVRHLGNGSLDGIPPPTLLDPAANDIAQIRYIKLSSPGLGKLNNVRLDADPNFKPPPKLLNTQRELAAIAKPINLVETVNWFARFAQATFEHYGYHVPMLFMFDDRWNQIDFLSTEFSDQADKYIFWRTMAERAAYLRARAIVWIGESWIRDAKQRYAVAVRNLPVIGEQLHVIGAEVTGAHHAIGWNIIRTEPGSHPTLSPVPEGDPLGMAGAWNFLKPALEAMRNARVPPNNAG